MCACTEVQPGERVVLFQCILELPGGGVSEQVPRCGNAWLVLNRDTYIELGEHTVPGQRIRNGLRSFRSDTALVLSESTLSQPTMSYKDSAI